MNKLKHLLVALLMLPLAGIAQEIKIEDFQKLERDMSARTAKVKDVNGDLCALLKIETTEKGFEFSGCNIEKTEQKTGEIWLFASPGVKFITIKHKDFGVLRNYQFPQSIESGVVYQIKLSTEAKEVKIDTASVSTLVESKIDAKLEELNRKLAALEQAQSQQNNTHSQTTPNVPKEEQRNEPEKYSIADGYINDHEYVDLGLSVKWATCNVGANAPHEYGGYFAWGETETKNEYTKKNCETVKYRKRLLGNLIRGPKIIDKRDNFKDVAQSNWGGTWRMPTKREMEELESKCTWKWTTQSGVNGYKVTGPNGNSIFLPATGHCDGSLSYGVGERGVYWSSTPDESRADDAYYLYFLDFFKKEWRSSHGVISLWRFYGHTVRPVSE